VSLSWENLGNLTILDSDDLVAWTKNKRKRFDAQEVRHDRRY
jgi:hypothetical protein